MKKLLYVILLSMFSCENHKQTTETFPPSAEENRAWITYEGRIPLDESTNLYLEIRMVSSNQSGDGVYEMKEYLEAPNNVSSPTSYKGKYSTLHGETPEEMIVQFYNSSHPDGLRRTYLTPGFRGNLTDSQLKMIREEPFRTTDLTVKTLGKDKLLVLDDHLQAVSNESEHNLVKRTSKPFTMEGYFRHNGDSADFVEMNTGERWAVTKYGEYHKAIREYHQLTRKKFDVTYLKGIGFSIRHINRQGRDVEALVIKRVLQMTSASEED
jgi:hypothetical protein